MELSRPADSPLNRREFLGSSARNAAEIAAGVAAGAVGWAGVASASHSAANQVRVGVIGVRNQGKTLGIALAGLGDVRVTTVCDVDDSQSALASQAVAAVQGWAPRCERDFRRVLDARDVDAVVIATPDHWHAPMTILACQASKDVYVEKPVSHALDDGLAMLKVARSQGRVVQSGLQQRSGSHFQSAVEYVRSGNLGPVHLAKAWTVHQRKSIGKRHTTDVPQGVDYDLWLGPAAARPFHPNRFHYNWHWFWDYGSGELGNWGVHLLDVARWGLGVGLPTRVSATGGKHYFQDDQETPDTLFVSYSYPESVITWEHRLWSAHAPEGRSAAVSFHGDRGTLIVDRGGWKVYGQRESVTAEAGELLAPHLRNFVECIRTRAAPVAELETGILSSALCHLGNISHRVGRSLELDPLSGEIRLDNAARGLARGTAREPWNTLAQTALS
jgi:predicted dehydrogenase